MQSGVGLGVVGLGVAGSRARRPRTRGAAPPRSDARPRARLATRRCARRPGPRPRCAAGTTCGAARRGHPTISAWPLRSTAVHSTPRRAVSSARSAAWYTMPAGFSWRCNARESNARHTPSAQRTRPETRTWVCNCGSPARDERCTNAAASRPCGVDLADPGLAGPGERRVLLQVRERRPPPRRRARRGPPCRSSRRPPPTATDTDLGAENVRSQPRDPIDAVPHPVGGAEGVPRARVASRRTSRASSSAPTSPSRPSAAEPAPTHRPWASPRPA